jgi:hypothetical protein
VGQKPGEGLVELGGQLGVPGIHLLQRPPGQPVQAAGLLGDDGGRARGPEDMPTSPTATSGATVRRRTGAPSGRGMTAVSVPDSGKNRSSAGSPCCIEQPETIKEVVGVAR